jgi:hypothetical protein
VVSAVIGRESKNGPASKVNIGGVPLEGAMKGLKETRPDFTKTAATVCG